MASSTSPARQSHPVRTLAILLAIVAAMYALMAATGAWKPRLGLDLAGGSTITLTASQENGQAVDPTSLEQARTIIQQRVDSIGVGEASVTTQGNQHIIVSVPNVSSDQLTSMVGKTAKLNFRNVYAAEPVAPQPSASATPSASPSASASASADPASNPTPGLPTAPPKPRTNKLLPFDTVMSWQPSAEDQKAFAEFSCGDPIQDYLDQALVTCDKSGTYKYLLGPVAIEGTHVKTATAGLPQGGVAPVVDLVFDSKGAADFGRLTTKLYAQTTPPLNQNAVVLDGVVESAPVIQAAIMNGQAQISGNFTQQSATDLANVLKYGALPLDFDVSEVQTVSPSLGGEQLRAGLIAGLIGLVLVLIYSLFYYRALFVVVVGSLAIAALLTWACLSLLGPATGLALNLPGVAGTLVGIGVTADSFVIYFERIRDELRDGRSLRSAIETGWKKSRGTIVISDMVSLLSAIVLFILSIGAVKGFAFTLGLTTLIDLAIIFWFTKPLLNLLVRTKYWGRGGKFSGFDPDYMGVTRESLLGLRQRGATTDRRRRGSRRTAESSDQAVAEEA